MKTSKANSQSAATHHRVVFFRKWAFSIYYGSRIEPIGVEKAENNDVAEHIRGRLF
jgi:hypothetical protein